MFTASFTSFLMGLIWGRGAISLEQLMDSSPFTY